MSRLPLKRFEISPEHQRILKAVVITDSGPGTILRDFDAFLNYLGGRELQVGGAHQLPRNVLPEINARLAHPLQLNLQRPQQKSYPHIHGLYLLARASGLAGVGGTDKKPFLFLDKGIYQSWECLNPTERYCSLLETWLLRGKPEIVGERVGGMFWVHDNFHMWMHFFGGISKKGLQVAGNKNDENLLPYLPGWHNLGLLDLFGLIQIEHGAPVEGKGWQIKLIKRTAFGEALLALLYSKFFRNANYLLRFEGKERTSVGVLQPALQPLFPDWKNNLSIPERVFREGMHIFKVSLGKLWFRVAIPANNSLDSLSSIILNSVKFDYDHLYEFSYKDPFGTLERINHPHMDEGPWASEVMVGDVPLRVGQRMTYLYDFGDNWEFDVILERVDPESRAKKPDLLEMHGKPPEQYPRWEE